VVENYSVKYNGSGFIQITLIIKDNEVEIPMLTFQMKRDESKLALNLGQELKQLLNSKIKNA
jgi:hypothetical protein